MVGDRGESVKLSISILQKTGAILLQLSFVSSVYVSSNLQRLEMLLSLQLKDTRSGLYCLDLKF